MSEANEKCPRCKGAGRVRVACTDLPDGFVMFNRTATFASHDGRVLIVCPRCDGDADSGAAVGLGRDKTGRGTETTRDAENVA